MISFRLKCFYYHHCFSICYITSLLIHQNVSPQLTYNSLPSNIVPSYIQCSHPKTNYHLCPWVGAQILPLKPTITLVTINTPIATLLPAPTPPFYFIFPFTPLTKSVSKKTLHKPIHPSSHFQRTLDLIIETWKQQYHEPCCDMDSVLRKRVYVLVKGICKLHWNFGQRHGVRTQTFYSVKKYCKILCLWSSVYQVHFLPYHRVACTHNKGAAMVYRHMERGEVAQGHTLLLSMKVV